MIRHLYASDAEDNHEAPWTPHADEGADPADVAREYAEEHGLDVGDVVTVIDASEVEDADAPELHVHQTWHFQVTIATDDGCEVVDVAIQRHEDMLTELKATTDPVAALCTWARFLRGEAERAHEGRRADLDTIAAALGLPPGCSVRDIVDVIECRGSK